MRREGTRNQEQGTRNEATEPRIIPRARARARARARTRAPAPAPARARARTRTRACAWPSVALWHPSPPERGRGAGGEGAKPPLKTPNPNTPRCPFASSRLRVRPTTGNGPRTPQRGPAIPLTPDPSPLPGARGASGAIYTATNTPNPPLAPNGGEGLGVRGEHHPKNTTPQHADKATHRCCAYQPPTLWPLYSLWFKKHHSHEAVQGRSRAGKPELRERADEGVSPLTPDPSPLPGARGASGASTLKNTTAALAFHP